MQHVILRALLLFLVGLVACNPTNKEQKNAEESNGPFVAGKPQVVAEDSQVVAIDNHVVRIDTTHSFVKSILNKSPEEVAKRLGHPDKGIRPTRDCVYLPSCTEATYRNGKYGVHYYNNALKSILIADYDYFDKRVVEFLGFPPWPPTVANKYIISWRGKANKAKPTGGPLIPVPGIISITVTPTKRSKGVVMIEIEADHGKGF